MLKHAKRGEPWECWFAKAIMAFAKKQPNAFPHPVIHAYVIRSAIYIIDRVRDGHVSHAVRYHHDRGPLTRVFDLLSKRSFLRYLEREGLAKEFDLIMRPAESGGHREPSDHVRKHGDPGTGRPPTFSRGAYLRAKEARLEV
jgi:hypothetical protein